MIGIEVGDEQIELLDPGVIETGVDRLRLFAGVDDQSPALTEVDHRARSLSDVADEHEPVRARRSGADRDDHRGGEDEAHDDDRQSPQATAHEHPRADDGHREQGRSQHSAHRRCRPVECGSRQGGADSGDFDDPPRRQGPEPGETAGDDVGSGQARGRDRLAHEAEETGHGGRQNGRRGQGVGGHRPQTDARVDGHEHRGAGQLRDEGDDEGGDQHGRHQRQVHGESAQQDRDDEHDRGRRDHGQDEAHRGGQDRDEGQQ